MPQENLQSTDLQIIARGKAKDRLGEGGEDWGRGPDAKAEIGSAVHQLALEVCHNFTGPQSIL